MSENRLSFSEDLRFETAAGRWEACGLLSVWDDEKRENTFQVLVSGMSKDNVQNFMQAQREKCNFMLEVQPEPFLSDEDEMLTDEPSFPFMLNPLGTGLCISITPQDIKTPKPCRISYHIALDTDDDRATSFSSEQFELNEGETYREITFQGRQAEVQCTVDSGKVEVWLEEKIGGKFEPCGEPQILSVNPSKQPVWVPGPGRSNPHTSRSGESVQWRVAVKGQQARNKCKITYDTIIRRGP